MISRLNRNWLCFLGKKINQMKCSVLEYPNFTLNLIRGGSVEEVPVADPRAYSRVEIPYNPDNLIGMAKKGYVFSDRTLGVAINLAKVDVDFQKMIRFDMQRLSDSTDEVLDIALHNFSMDSRFYIRSEPDKLTAEAIICSWMKDLSELYSCIHKEKTVGFLDLEPFDGNNCFIHLAAVREDYRATGAAASLYAFAIHTAKTRGCSRIYGRVSTRNTSVMNLYARFGGIFSEPMDVYVRDELHESK